MKLNNKKGLSIITKDMSDKDRAFYLKEKEINTVNNLGELLDEEQKDVILTGKRKEVQKELMKYAENRYIFKRYIIGDTNLIAYFSRNNLYESIHKATNLIGMFYIVDNFNEIIYNSIKIEEHSDIKNSINIKMIHEYISLLKCYGEIFIIKITVKETTRVIENNIIYSISNLDIIKEMNVNPLPVSKKQSQILEAGLRTSHTYNFAQLIKHVNSPDILRYIPNELLDNEQIKVKEEALIEYKRIKEIQLKKNV